MTREELRKYASEAKANGLARLLGSTGDPDAIEQLRRGLEAELLYLDPWTENDGEEFAETDDPPAEEPPKMTEEPAPPCGPKSEPESNG